MLADNITYFRFVESRSVAGTVDDNLGIRDLEPTTSAVSEWHRDLKFSVSGSFAQLHPREAQHRYSHKLHFRRNRRSLSLECKENFLQLSR